MLIKGTSSEVKAELQRLAAKYGNLTLAELKTKLSEEKTGVSND